MVGDGCDAVQPKDEMDCAKDARGRPTMVSKLAAPWGYGCADMFNSDARLLCENPASGAVGSSARASTSPWASSSFLVPNITSGTFC